MKINNLLKFIITIAILGLAVVILNLYHSREKDNLIRVFSPRANEEISSPLLVTGEARGSWYFEASFPVIIVDDNGFILGVRPAQASSDWMTDDFVPFSAIIPFAVPSTVKGKLILERDNPSGLPENADERIIQVYFKDAPEILSDSTTVKIFLSDSRFAAEPYFDCSKTIALDRQVPKTQAVARAAIEALLRGATAEERNQGYVSNINSGVGLRGIVIKDGTAKVDFDEQLEFQVGGSCRVAAIRAQITDTLKQFPAVNNVIISVNGRTEDILQP